MEQRLSKPKVEKKRFLRELLFRSLYAMEFTDNADDALLDMISKDFSERTKKQMLLDEDEKSEIINKADSIMAKKADLDSTIEKFLVSWKMDRLPMVDVCILRMAVYDLLYNTSVPENVTINEAVLIADKFSDEKDKKFINGILSSVLKLLKEKENNTEKFIECIKDKELLK